MRQSWLKPLSVPQKHPKVKKLAGRSPTQIAFERLRKDKMAIVCTVIVVLMVLAAVLAPWICKALNIYPTVQTMPYQSSDVLDFDGPTTACRSTARPTTASGRPTRSGSRPTTGDDNLARLLYGLRTDLLIATVATVLSIGIGVVLGLIAGFSRGWLDRIITFVTDLFLSFPFLLGALAMAPIIVERFGKPGTTSTSSTACSSSP